MRSVQLLLVVRRSLARGPKFTGGWASQAQVRPTDQHFSWKEFVFHLFGQAARKVSLTNVRFLETGGSKRYMLALAVSVALAAADRL